MKPIAVLIVACLALVACGRSSPEDLKVAAAQDKVADIYDYVEDGEWTAFLDLAVGTQEKGRLLKDKTPEQFAEEMNAKDMTQVLAILAQMMDSEAYYYYAEGGDEVAFPLAEPVGDIEVVTMKMDDGIGEWVLALARKAK